MGGPNAEFLAGARSLESLYLESNDPHVQSGFSGGRDTWVDVTSWAEERGFSVVPHGVDIGGRLIGLARERLTAFADNFVWEQIARSRPCRRGWSDGAVRIDSGRFDCGR